MQIIGTRDLRANLASILDRAETEDIIIQRRNGTLIRLMPIQVAVTRKVRRVDMEKEIGKFMRKKIDPYNDNLNSAVHKAVDHFTKLKRIKG